MKFKIIRPKKKKIKEKWKKIPWAKEYQISNFGRVKSYKFNKEKFISHTTKCNGYPAVKINRKNLKIHRLVALLFGLIKEGDMVNHIDGNKCNNHISNLEKTDWTKNANHAQRIGLLKRQIGAMSGTAKLTEYDARNIILKYGVGNRAVDIAKEYKITASNVYAIGCGNSWKCLDKFRHQHGVTPRKKKK